MAELLRKLTRRAKLYIQVTHVSEIARRYFVKNGMDGLMTTLGIVLGAWAVGAENANLIVATGLGACLAMGISGLFGTYITERAERKRRLKQLEESLLSDLNDSLHKNAEEVVSVFAALVDGLSPSLTATVCLVPFFLTTIGALIIWDAYLISFIITFATLFSLGVYLGTVAKENMLLYGFQMLGSGLLIALIIFLFGGI